MSKNIFIYNPMLITKKKLQDLPGIRAFRQAFNLFNENVVLIDRTHTIQVPVNVAVHAPIPEFRKIDKSYEQICDERAQELLRRSDEHDLPINVFYSGGIDSTLVMVSLLKNATEEQKNRICAFMSQESINENPAFYRDHLRGKVKLEAAAVYPYALSKRALFVGGEYNDQIFGSALFKDFLDVHGEEALAKKYSRNQMAQMFGRKWHNDAVISWYMDLFEKVRAAAPCPVESNADFLWWINFSLKWQSVYFRMLTYASDFVVHNIDRDFIDNYFFHFYGTDDFQLWSMGNPDKRVVTKWESYKQEAKDVIYRFNKDSDYRDFKTKNGSLAWVIMHQIQKNFIDDQMHMYMTLPRTDWFNPNNSFKDAPF
ncbi:MAG: hypothetical protein JSU04_00680 [Bdellovibrionales bacterium]|nr:hypothetical protein [Bdellovibrionales bacterium]